MRKEINIRINFYNLLVPRWPLCCSQHPTVHEPRLLHLQVLHLLTYYSSSFHLVACNFGISVWKHEISNILCFAINEFKKIKIIHWNKRFTLAILHPCCSYFPYFLHSSFWVPEAVLFFSVPPLPMNQFCLLTFLKPLRLNPD